MFPGTDSSVFILHSLVQRVFLLCLSCQLPGKYQGLQMYLYGTHLTDPKDDHVLQTGAAQNKRLCSAGHTVSRELHGR